MNLIRDDQNTMLFTEFANPIEFLRSPDPPGRILRVAEQKKRGLWV